MFVKINNTPNVAQGAQYGVRNIKLSHFPSVKSDSKGEIDLEDFVEKVSGEEYKESIEEIRSHLNSGDNESAKRAKEQLESYTL